MRHNKSLSGKRIFITGGTGGIGRPLVARLIAAGAQVEIYKRAQQGTLSARLDAICESLAHNPPDILINMAGQNTLSPCEDQDVTSLLSINLEIPIRLAQAVLPGMKKRGSGQIVNIGSMAGMIPLPYMSLYCAAKAGLKAFSDSLRRETNGTGIDVIHIAPRAVNTSMNHGILGLLNDQTHTATDDPAAVADRIINALIRAESDVRIGWPERFFAIMHMAAPAIVDKGLQSYGRIATELLSTHKTKEIKNETIPDTQRRAAS